MSPTNTRYRMAKKELNSPSDLSKADAINPIDTNYNQNHNNKPVSDPINSFYPFLKRQDPSSSTYPPTRLDSSFFEPTNSPTSTTTTATPVNKPKGGDPLSNIVVQLILAGLAGILILAVVIRCFHVNRQQRSLLDAQRRQNRTTAQAQLSIHHSAYYSHTSHPHGTQTMVTPLGTHLIPTNQTTLAARLRMYQAQSESWRDPFPYGQQPTLGRLNTSAMESTNSIVAPSYEHDVSPPPFMNSVGKPPAYAEIIHVAPISVITESRPQSVPVSVQALAPSPASQPSLLPQQQQSEHSHHQQQDLEQVEVVENSRRLV
ncbi:hypothetical protein FBU30_000181 [Linnemannia zychae]|nr:hypothetical protein FBU30_000181 [Linnemannia zychae]